MMRKLLSKTLGWTRPYQYARHGNIVMHEYKAIYFYIPKVACSSIKLAVADLIGVPSPDPTNKFAYPHKRNYPFVKRDALEKYNDYFKFSFVRNPWDRVLSCYRNKIVGVREGKFGKQELPVFLKYDSRRFSLDMSFEEFVEVLMEVPDSTADPHYRSQYTFIEDPQGKDIVDFLGHFENLDHDLEVVSNKLDIPPIILPHTMKSPRERAYRDYYNPKTKELIAERYEKDIQKFGYEF